MHPAMFLSVVSLALLIVAHAIPPFPPRPNYGINWRRRLSTMSGRCMRTYEYNPAKLNWNSARKTCIYHGGRLAVLDNLAEADYFTSRFGSVSKKGLWLGASDRGREGHWRWDGGKGGWRAWPMYFTNWKRGEPRHKYRNYNCLLHSKGGFWTTQDCSKEHAYVCQYKVCGGLLKDGENSVDGVQGLTGPGIPAENSTDSSWAPSVNVKQQEKPTDLVVEKAGQEAISGEAKPAVNEKQREKPTGKVVEKAGQEAISGEAKSAVHPLNALARGSEQKASQIYPNDKDAENDKGEYFSKAKQSPELTVNKDAKHDGRSQGKSAEGDVKAFTQSGNSPPSDDTAPLNAKSYINDKDDSHDQGEYNSRLGTLNNTASVDLDDQRNASRGTESMHSNVERFMPGSSSNGTLSEGSPTEDDVTVDAVASSPSSNETSIGAGVSPLGSKNSTSGNFTTGNFTSGNSTSADSASSRSSSGRASGNNTSSGSSSDSSTEVLHNVEQEEASLDKAKGTATKETPKDKKAFTKLLGLLLQHISSIQKRKKSCMAPPETNGAWTCNTNTYPWICILDCGGGQAAGDGIVNQDGYSPVDGVIVCNDGDWSRDDYYCVPPRLHHVAKPQ